MTDFWRGNEPISLSKAIENTMKAMQQAKFDRNRCVSCRTAFRYSEDNNDKSLGRIYSDAGIKEARISFLCETCFDEITAFDNEAECEWDCDGENISRYCNYHGNGEYTSGGWFNIPNEPAEMIWGHA